MAKLRKPPTEPVEIVTDDTPDQPVVIELEEGTYQPLVIPLETETEPAEDDAVKKALAATQRADDLQRSLAEANRRADEQTRLALSREEELTRERGDRVDAEYNSVLTAIAAEQATLEQAKANYTSSAAAGDWAAAGEAQSVMARASARIDRLEDNKSTFDTKREQDKKAPPTSRQSAPDFETQIRTLPEPAKTWLRSHPDYWNDPVKNRQIQGLHGYLVDTRRIPEFSKEYFDEVDIQLGLKARPEPSQERETQQTQQPQRRSMPVSAPVSRDVPNPSGQRPSTSRITLSPEQREIARKSFTATDMTDEQKERLYAMNLQKLHWLRANGQYPHITEQTG